MSLIVRLGIASLRSAPHHVAIKIRSRECKLGLTDVDIMNNDRNFNAPDWHFNLESINIEINFYYSRHPKHNKKKQQMVELI